MARPHERFTTASPYDRQESDRFYDDLMGTGSGAAPIRSRVPPGYGLRRGMSREGEDSEAADPAARLVHDPKRGFAWILPKSSMMTPAVRREGVAAEGVNEEIFAPDTRQVVPDTTAIAFRFVCCLDLLFDHPKDPSQTLLLRGSGTLISDRHVLTCAHNILNVLPGFAGDGRRRVQRIMAAPGRNGRTLPFGEAGSVTTRVPTEWATADNAEFDFALVTLDNAIGATTFAALGGAALGFWSHPRLGGGTHIRPLDVAWLPGRPVNLDGYPSDKCLDQPPSRALTPAEAAACTGTVPGNPRLRDLGSMQWRSFGNVVEASPPSMPRVITYNNDSAVGHSGGPIWLRWEQYRNLIAVNTGGYPSATPPFTIVANMGVRITDAVLKTVRGWMKADGVNPTF
jgi:V8-like Glu-specific endopeptidase